MFKNFDPAKHIVTFKGYVLTGFAAGTYVSVERHEDTYTYQYGAHGDMVRVRNRKRGGRATVNLMGISPSNDILSTILALDETTGLGYGAFQVIDLNSNTVVHATNAWIVRPANFTVADDHTDREWMFDLENVDMTIAGAVI